MSFKKIFILATSLITLTSCNITKDLWDKHYDEEIYNFLVTQDGSQVVFLGEKYDYVVADDYGQMKQILFWSGKKSVFLDRSQTDLTIDDNNNVKGYITIKSYKKIMPIENFNFLQSIGFRKDSHDLLSLRLPLHGKRYARQANSRYYAHSLTREYNVKIKMKLGIFGSVARLSVTPITMAADAVLFIGGARLYRFDE